LGEPTEVLVNKAYLPVLSDESRFKVLYGGAGSGKSHFVAQSVVLRCLKEKGRRFLIVRKVARTLRYSVIVLIREIIATMGLENVFEVNRTDMTITCRLNGNQLLFLGLDDVEKLKSIHGITDIWIEEASEVLQSDFEQLNLRLRGNPEIKKQVVLTFNPISATHWLKQYFFDRRRDNTFILKTTYKDNAFLDDEYIKELESLKDRDYTYYQIYTLGEWGILGNLIYTNYVIEDIPQDSSAYGSTYAGLDFGFNDPSALVRIGWKDSELYVFDELYQSGLTNAELIEAAAEMVPRNEHITADSAEPDRILEFRRAGFKIYPAKKGKDSVKFGIDWVKRHRIHIHPSCQNFINEIQGYKYREDRDGNVLDEPVNMHDHLMDALRYATEPLRRGPARVMQKPRGF